MSIKKLLIILGIIAMILVSITIVAGLIIYLVMNIQGVTYIKNTELISNLENPTTEGTCTLDLSPNVIISGDQVRGTLIDGKETFCQVYANDGTGWSLVFEGYTDSTGKISSFQTVNPVGEFTFRGYCDLNGNGIVDSKDCITNAEKLIVNPYIPPSGGYEVGDIVGGISEEGILGPDGMSFLIDLNDVETGGNCSLGARISIYWDYVDASECSGIQGSEDMNFYFFDSNTGRDLDVARGITRNFDFCPLNWDGVNQWHLDMEKVLNLPDCQITYDINVEVYVCECI